MKVVLPGGAGLVGQNLIVRLKAKGYRNITVIDKHQDNVKILKTLHPDIQVIPADLSVPGGWEGVLSSANIVVMLQAQIGGINFQEFERNNVQSTHLILKQLEKNPAIRLVHISSSVVTSKANDFYSQTKRTQEKLVLESDVHCPVLRPTLMFGWYDRKHLGWLSRFMEKMPIFPIPGNGKYMRQPLYVGDFCNVIIKCIEDHHLNGIYNITGTEKIDYVDIIKNIKTVINSRVKIIHLPYRLFYSLLAVWAWFDKNPPFTTQQLAALVTDDVFEVDDWPNTFHVSATPFSVALAETFCDPIHSNVVLQF